MIKISEIIRAINIKLNKNFPSVKIDDKNLSERFERPSFRVQIERITTEAFMTRYKKRNLVIKIYYFAKEKEKNKFENITIQEKMEDIFFLNLEVERDKFPPFIFPIDEINFVETDGVLIASFDSYTMEEIENDITSQMMEELEYRR